MGNQNSSARRNDSSTVGRPSGAIVPSSSVGDHHRAQRRNREVGNAQLVVEGPLNSSKKVPVYFEKAKPIPLNLRKETLKAKPFPEDPSLLLVEFIFDSAIAGYITIYYFAKQVSSTSFTSFEGKFEKYPGKTSFLPGTQQLYRQKPTKGLKIDKSLREELFYKGGFRFPLVIVLESRQEPRSLSPNFSSSSKEQSAEATAQLTFGTFVRNPDNSLGLKCIKQQMVINGDLYQLEDIFGLEDDNCRSSQPCLVCMLDNMNTLLLPCRHLCLCTACAERIRVRSSCCPLCRKPIAQVLQIHSRFLQKH